MTWLIAERAALEALQDRLSLLAGLVLALPVPLAVLLLALRPAASGDATAPALGGAVALYLLVVGMLPTFSAVGIAAGQFAGEKERGVLTPLLASPASNLAIFAGKVLGAIIPPLIYAALAESVYLAGLALLFGTAMPGLLPLWLVAATCLLVPAVTCFAAVVASLVSSRVRTFNAAQQVGGLLLTPVWGLVFALADRLRDWGPAGLFALAVGLLLVDAAATLWAAATWRREEVLAQR
jgi:ABC-type transport system involved in multi-copper enzyme maturation permease subunit